MLILIFLKFSVTFRIFNRTGSGFVSQEELYDMYISTYSALMQSLRVAITPPEFVDNPEANRFQDELIKNLQKKFEGIMVGVARNIMKEMDSDGDNKLSKDEFREYIAAQPYVKASYQLKFTKEGLEHAYQDDGSFLFIFI